jgi:hypothetical protein
VKGSWATVSRFIGHQCSSALLDVYTSSPFSFGSFCRSDTTPKPRSANTMSRSASSRSVRTAGKPSGYDNPLFMPGDVLGDREADSADCLPLVVADQANAVLTPQRRPESPLVAKLKVQASEKGYKLRQDRILVCRALAVGGILLCTPDLLHRIPSNLPRLTVCSESRTFWGLTRVMNFRGVRSW